MGRGCHFAFLSRRRLMPGARAPTRTRSGNFERMASNSAVAHDDPRISLGPVVAIAGDQAHTVAVADHDQPVAVVFNFVERGRRPATANNAPARLPPGGADIRNNHRCSICFHQARN
jgi:hypothetical protein